MQEGSETGEVGGEEDLDRLAREIEATNAEETTGKKKKRRRRRRQEIRERRAMLMEDLSWLENALKRMENSLLGSKPATLGDLEQDIEKEGSYSLQQVLDQFKELRDRKLNIETELKQLADDRHIRHQSADPIRSANDVAPDLSLDESRRVSEMVSDVEEERKKNLQERQRLIEQIDKVQDERICQDLARVEMEDVEEDQTENGYDELLTEGGNLTDEAHTHSTNQKEDEKDLLCEEKEGNRLDEEQKQIFSPENRKRSEQSLEQVSLSDLQLEEQDETLPADMKWKIEKEVLEDNEKKCREMCKDDNELERKMGSIVQCEKRKRFRRKVKVCWLCAAAKTAEGFDLHWCAGCRKAR